MTISIKKLLNYSWISQASYLDFTGLSNGALGEALINKLKGTTLNSGKILADEQAVRFVDPTDGFNFVHYKPNDSTGFSATVFNSNVNNSKRRADKFTQSAG